MIYLYILTSRSLLTSLYTAVFSGRDIRELLHSLRLLPSFDPMRSKFLTIRNGGKLNSRGRLCNKINVDYDLRFKTGLGSEWTSHHSVMESENCRRK